ncbi:MAG: hypothetical protein AAFN94_16105 [Pseudomonadota bacterium]
MDRPFGEDFFKTEKVAVCFGAAAVWWRFAGGLLRGAARVVERPFGEDFLETEKGAVCGIGCPVFLVG